MTVSVSFLPGSGEMVRDPLYGFLDNSSLCLSDSRIGKAMTPMLTLSKNEPTNHNPWRVHTRSTESDAENEEYRTWVQGTGSPTPTISCPLSGSRTYLSHTRVTFRQTTQTYKHSLESKFRCQKEKIPNEENRVSPIFTF